MTSQGTWGFTTSSDTSVKLGEFTFYWNDRNKIYTVTHHSLTGIVCQVEPYKGEAHHNLSDPKKMYTVKASDYPGVGQLNQMVKGSDLYSYLESVLLGRK